MKFLLIALVALPHLAQAAGSCSCVGRCTGPTIEEQWKVIGKGHDKASCLAAMKEECGRGVKLDHYNSCSDSGKAASPTADEGGEDDQ